MEKPDTLAQDGSSEDVENTGVMVNADGDFVIAKPDKATWELYQERAKASAAAAAEAAAAEYSRELQTRGLECPIDKRMFLEPTKTPCCHRTYCNDCITNALIESDFVCPGCGTEGVLLDNLTFDDVAATKIKDYEAEKTDAKKEKEKHAGQDNDEPPMKEDALEENGGSPARAETSPTSTSQPTQVQPKKRPAESDRTSAEPQSSNSVPSAKRQKSDSVSSPRTDKSEAVMENVASSGFPSMMPFNQQVPFCNPGMMQQPATAAMSFPNPVFMNPMMFPAGGFPNNLDPMWAAQMNAAANFGSQNNGVYGGNTNGPMSNPYQTMNMYGGVGELPLNMFNGGQMAGPMQQQGSAGGFRGPRAGHFSNQQRTAFSTPFTREEDTAYFRQPVNPQRHQARHRRIRPSDYREL